MLPLAEVSHAGTRHLRLRVPERRGDASYFQQVAEALARLPGVERVEANPLTGGILLVPGAVGATLAAQAEAAGLFRLGPAPAAVPLTESVAAAFRDLNTELTRLSGNRVNLASVGFVGLVGAAVVQLRNGHILGPAGTLLWYAAGLLLMTEAARAAKAKAS